MTMGPDDVRRRLAMANDGAGSRVAADRTATPSVPGETDAVLASITSSYFRLRRGLAVITLAFPLVLWLGAGVDRLQASISAYYHFAATLVVPRYGAGTMRDVFVGVLWTIGSFLFFYRGYSRAEDRALNLAGVAAVALSLCPMDWPDGSPATLTGRAHGAAAIVFFLAIAYVAIGRASDTLVLLRDDAKRTMFRRTYTVLGMLMIVIPLGVFAARTLFDHRPTTIALWLIEVAAIYVFAAFWLVKSREIALIEAQPAA